MTLHVRTTRLFLIITLPLQLINAPVIDGVSVAHLLRFRMLLCLYHETHKKKHASKIYICFIRNYSKLSLLFYIVYIHFLPVSSNIDSIYFDKFIHISFYSKLFLIKIHCCRIQTTTKIYNVRFPKMILRALFSL